MATLVNPILRVTDNVTGVPIPGALIFFLSPGLSWPSGAKNAFLDLAMTLPCANPLHCDGDGYASGAGAGIYLSGAYQIVATSPDGGSSGYGSTIYFEIPNFQGIGNPGQFVSPSSYANFNAAVTAIGNTPATLLISTAQTLSGTVTIPSTLTLQFVQGGSIALAGYTLTINSYFPRTGTNQWFTGTGSVVFGPGTLDYTADPAWFGGGGPGTSMAMAAAINVIVTFPANAATPDVSVLAGINGTFQTNNSSNTNITDFTNKVPGQQFKVIVTDAFTTFAGPSIRNLPASTPQYTTLDFVVGDIGHTYCIGPPQTITPEFRNRLINAEMRIDRYNAGASANVANGTSVYVIDRWLLYSAGANIAAQQVGGSGQFANLYQINGASGSNTIQFEQRVLSNNVKDMATGTQIASISAYIQASANQNIQWTALVPGSLDNWGSQAQVANGIWSISGGLTQYSANFVVPANAANGLGVSFIISNLTSGFVQFTGVQLEPGPVVTAFDRRPDDIETLRAYPYYPGFRAGANFVTSSSAGPFFGQGTTGNQVFVVMPFTLPARVQPFAGNAVYSNAANLFAVSTSNGNTSLLPAFPLTFLYSGSGMGFGSTLTAGAFLANANTVATITAGQIIQFWFGPNAYIFFNCEL